MNEYEKILELTDDSRVELATPFRDMIGKQFCLGMTKYVAQNGTLSDGHEIITDADRYFQANKEIYVLRNSMLEYRVLAMRAQADLLDAKHRRELATKQSEELRADADILSAQNRLFTALVSVEDSKRVYDAFVEVRNELAPKVMAQYPDGIEQAQEDIYLARAKYRHLKRNMGYPENLTHIPLEKETKAKLGLDLQSPDLCAWAIVSDNAKMAELAHQHEKVVKLKEVANV
jgi:hypothetical protein